jgi:hypothetical protein
LESSFGHRMRAVISLNGLGLEPNGTYAGLGALRLSPRGVVARSTVEPRCRPQPPLDHDLTHPTEDCNSLQLCGGEPPSPRLGRGPQARGARGSRSKTPTADGRRG